MGPLSAIVANVARRAMPHLAAHETTYLVRHGDARRFFAYAQFRGFIGDAEGIRAE